MSNEANENLMLWLVYMYKVNAVPFSHHFTNMYINYDFIDGILLREYAHFVSSCRPRSSSPCTAFRAQDGTQWNGTCSTKHFQLVEQLISKRDRLGFNLIRRHFPMGKNWTGSTGSGTSSSCPILCRHFRRLAHLAHPTGALKAMTGVVFAVRPSPFYIVNLCSACMC